MALRVAMVVPSLVVGGAETFALQLSEALLDAGHDAWLVTLKGGGPLADRRSAALAERTVVLSKRSRWDASVLPRAVAALRRIDPDVVHTHLFTALSWGTVAARAAGVPVVVHTQHACHDDEYAYLPAVRRQLSRAVDEVVGCSPAVVRDVHRRGYSPYAPVRCIENGIPLAGRPQASLDGAPLRVGTVGRMVPIKGQTHLVTAVGLLRDQGVHVHLTLVGDGEVRDALEAQVDRLDLRDRVTFTGRVADVPDRLAAMDLFVLPSLSEALPIAALEAAAAGLPMLVTTGGGGPTLLEAGASGWAVPPGDAAALAERIAHYAALPVDERQRLGAASKALVLAEYDIASTASAYVDLYRSLLA
jgi:glycosyltransferase involved in cell wall biosynthesis